jgi:hypothetical protein
MNREALCDKIKALLSKTTANGCTEQEAMAALAKARAMQDAYAVTDEELQLTKIEVAELLRKAKMKLIPTRSNGECHMPFRSSAIVRFGAAGPLAFICSVACVPTLILRCS